MCFLELVSAAYVLPTTGNRKTQVKCIVLISDLSDQGTTLSKEPLRKPPVPSLFYDHRYLRDWVGLSILWRIYVHSAFSSKRGRACTTRNQTQKVDRQLSI